MQRTFTFMFMRSFYCHHNSSIWLNSNQWWQRTSLSLPWSVSLVLLSDYRFLFPSRGRQITYFFYLKTENGGLLFLPTKMTLYSNNAGYFDKWLLPVVWSVWLLSDHFEVLIAISYWWSRTYWDYIFWFIYNFSKWDDLELTRGKVETFE